MIKEAITHAGAVASPSMRSQVRRERGGKGMEGRWKGEREGKGREGRRIEKEDGREEREGEEGEMWKINKEMVSW